MGIKLIVIVLFVLFCLLQYRLWFGDGSIRQSWGLQQRLEVLHQEKEKLEQRNQRMEAEIMSLKNGLGSIEAHARKDLGMIRKGETFFQIVDESEAEGEK